jgi:hypothetical protein
MAPTVANYDERGEAKVLTALHYLGHAIDGDNVVLEVGRIDVHQASYR